MGFLFGCWYIAAWSDDLPAAGMLSRTILGEPVLLLRDEDGLIGAVRDMCPHRFAPLSRGNFAGGKVTCGYHGLGFALDGRCVANPHGPVVSGLNVKSWPVHEAYKAIWIWMGDPAQADPALIPDLGYIDACPPSAFSKGYLSSYGNYQLYVDNILDLSHIDYLHPTTLGGGALSRATPRVQSRDVATTGQIEAMLISGRPDPFGRLYQRLARTIDRGHTSADRRCASCACRVEQERRLAGDEAVVLVVVVFRKQADRVGGRRPRHNLDGAAIDLGRHSMSGKPRCRSRTE